MSCRGPWASKEKLYRSKEENMARGRVISKEITADKKINDLGSDTSRLAFTWLITFADAEGRTYGDPAMVRSMVFPRRDDISIEEMETYIREWKNAGLVDWYEAEGDLWISFPHFGDHQVGVRADREAPSHVPPKPIDTPELVRSDAGATPEENGLIKLNLTESNSSKKPAVTPPPVNGKFPYRDELIKHFLTKTGLPAPKAKTQGEIKACQKLWWGPAKEIYELANQDIDKAKALIDKALERLRDVTVSDLNSIIKTVRAVSAKQAGAQYSEVY
jgi:hypothetical protein